MPTPPHQTDIILTTLNARYIHSAFGLRYLYANLGPLKSRARLLEFTINQPPLDIAEQLLSVQPKIISFGVYIWNVAQTQAVISVIRSLSPQTSIILGGPEVSHPPDLPDVARQVDYIITGPGERALPELCTAILEGKPPQQNIIPGIPLPLDEIALPYRYYSDEDIQHRIIYVEASRGCPFKCEFCLSSLDKTSKPFPLDRFLAEMEILLQRGARHFKFIDRTFNLNIATSITILEFFLERMTPGLYLHFEVIPDRLPEKLREVLQRFPDGALQFEIGVQTFDPNIQTLISRRQDNDATRDNLRWLRENTGAHIHADLIFGLPDDSLRNFASSFDDLVSLGPQEIQLGILKRLRGAPLNRHNEHFEMRYNPNPPYNILATSKIDFATMQRINRFARYWDLIGNSGHFRHSLPLLLASEPFDHFLQLADTLYATSGSTTKIALRRLFTLLYHAAQRRTDLDLNTFSEALEKDWMHSPLKGPAPFIDFPKDAAAQSTPKLANQRQMRHL